MNNIAVLINTCDSYSDVWELFIRSFEEYFPECDIPIYFNTESIKSLPFETALNVKFINNNNIPWGKRLRNALQSIDEEFVLNIFDDYLLEDKLDIIKLQNVLNIISFNEFISAVYLNAVSVRYHKNIHHAGFREIRNFTEYRVNSAPGLWRKKDLINLTCDDDTPWSWEVFGTYRSFSPKKYFLSVSSVDDNIYSYDYKKGGAIYRGKWVADVIDKKLIKYGITLNPKKRGYSEQSTYEKRSFNWKFNFIKQGIKTDGYKAVWYLFFYVRNKLNF